MIALCAGQDLEQFGLRSFELAHLSIWDPLKGHENISLIINNSAVHFLIVFKLGRLVHYMRFLRLRNYEHPHTVKYKMADTGSIQK